MAFKKVFASNENKAVLKGFIQDFYELTIRDIWIENPYSIEEFNKNINEVGYFDTAVDTLCTDERGYRFTAEMQVRSQKFFGKRALYYLFNKYCSNYGIESMVDGGKSKYSSLRPTYAINIVDYDYFKDTDSIHQFTLHDIKNNVKFSKQDLVSLGFFEIRKTDPNMSKVLQFWREFFLTGKAPDNAPDYIKQAEKQMLLSEFSKEERAMIDTIERIKEDRLARELLVQEQSEQKGMNQILELVEQGLSADEIRKYIADQKKAKDE